MLHPGPRQLLQVPIAQVIVDRRAHVLVRQVDAAHALVVGRERHRHMRRAIDRKRMLMRP